MSGWPHVYEYAQYDGNGTDNPLKGNWAKSVFGNDNSVVLELGCGKGEYTVALAELYPDKNFVGVDIKGARLWTGAKDALDKNLKNVAFLRTHIEFISRFFANGEITEIWLTFPDPQMKKVSKRLTSSHFMADYKQFIQINGKIHLKTDSAFMYRYTAEMANKNGLKVIFDTEDLYNCGWADKILSIQTFYEKQWLQRGLKIKYIQFEMPEVILWQEPDIEIEPDPYRSFGRSARNLVTDVKTI